MPNKGILGEYEPAVYRNIFEFPAPGWIHVLIRYSNPEAMDRDEVLGAIWSIDPEVPAQITGTFEEYLSEKLSVYDALSDALLILAVCALGLAVSGTLAVVSHMVSRQLGGLAVKMALGLTPGRAFGELAAGVLLLVVVGSSLSGLLFQPLIGLVSARTQVVLAFGPSILIPAVTLYLLLAGVAIWLAGRPIYRLNLADLLRRPGDGSNLSVVH